MASMKTLATLTVFGVLAFISFAGIFGASKEVLSSLPSSNVLSGLRGSEGRLRARKRIVLPTVGYGEGLRGKLDGKMAAIRTKMDGKMQALRGKVDGNTATILRGERLGLGGKFGRFGRVGRGFRANLFGKLGRGGRWSSIVDGKMAKVRGIVDWKRGKVDKILNWKRQKVDNILKWKGDTLSQLGGRFRRGGLFSRKGRVADVLDGKLQGIRSRPKPALFDGKVKNVFRRLGALDGIGADVLSSIKLERRRGLPKLGLRKKNLLSDITDASSGPSVLGGRLGRKKLRSGKLLGGGLKGKLGVRLGSFRLGGARLGRLTRLGGGRVGRLGGGKLRLGRIGGLKLRKPFGRFGRKVSPETMELLANGISQGLTFALNKKATTSVSDEHHQRQLKDLAQSVVGEGVLLNRPYHFARLPRIAKRGRFSRKNRKEKRLIDGKMQRIGSLVDGKMAKLNKLVDGKFAKIDGKLAKLDGKFSRLGSRIGGKKLRGSRRPIVKPLKGNLDNVAFPSIPMLRKYSFGRNHRFGKIRSGRLAEMLDGKMKDIRSGRLSEVFDGKLEKLRGGRVFGGRRWVGKSRKFRKFPKLSDAFDRPGSFAKVKRFSGLKVGDGKFGKFGKAGKFVKGGRYFVKPKRGKMLKVGNQKKFDTAGKLLKGGQPIKDVNILNIGKKKTIGHKLGKAGKKVKKNIGNGALGKLGKAEKLQTYTTTPSPSTTTPSPSTLPSNISNSTTMSPTTTVAPTVTTTVSWPTTSEQAEASSPTSAEAPVETVSIPAEIIAAAISAEASNAAAPTMLFGESSELEEKNKLAEMFRTIPEEEVVRAAEASPMGHSLIDALEELKKENVPEATEEFLEGMAFGEEDITKQYERRVEMAREKYGF